MPKSKQAGMGRDVEQQGETLKPSKLFINCAKLASNQQEVLQAGEGEAGGGRAVKGRGRGCTPSCQVVAAAERQFV